MKILVIRFLLIDKWLHASESLNCLQALAEKGVDVTCIFPVMKAIPEIARENFRIEGVCLRRIIPILSYLLFFIRAWPLFIKLRRNMDWVVLEAEDALLFAPILLLAAGGLRRGSRVAVRETSLPVELGSSHSYYKYISHRLSLLLSRFSDAMFAISSMRAEEIQRKYRIKEVHVWPPSVDTGLFNPANYTADRSRIRESLGIRDRTLLIYHGGLTHERGLYELVEAIGIVHKAREDVSLLLLGKGQAEPRLRELVLSSGLSDVVIFHEAVPYSEVPQFIAAADIGIVPLPDRPQWRYQQPTKLLEYLAMQKPVIVTDIPAHRSIAKDYPAAYFCKKGRPDDIAEAVLLRLHKKGCVTTDYRNEIATRFSPDAISDMLRRVLARENRRTFSKN